MKRGNQAKLDRVSDRTERQSIHKSNHQTWYALGTGGKNKEGFMIFEDVAHRRDAVVRSEKWAKRNGYKITYLNMMG